MTAFEAYLRLAACTHFADKVYSEIRCLGFKTLVWFCFLFRLWGRFLFFALCI